MNTDDLIKRPELEEMLSGARIKRCEYWIQSRAPGEEMWSYSIVFTDEARARESARIRGMVTGRQWRVLRVEVLE